MVEGMVVMEAMVEGMAGASWAVSRSMPAGPRGEAGAGGGREGSVLQ